MKTLEDARHLRSHILSAFEMAELATDPAEQAAYLTFAVVGAGPTGVELVGQLAELAHQVLPRDYRSVVTTEARILLIEAALRFWVRSTRSCSATPSGGWRRWASRSG